MSQPDALTFRVIGAMAEISAAQWDACANPAGLSRNPFISHAFLSALEDSGSAVAETGWGPRHLILEDDKGLAACAPMYLKGHSYGEYVFDHAWAHAFERAGGAYYPKLQVAVPFTPASGRRLLIRGDLDRARFEPALAAGFAAAAREFEVSSLHIAFPTEREYAALGEAGYLARTDQQFHWENRGYASFDEFLGDLASRKRKQIRKERARAVMDGIGIEIVSGRDLSETHWDAFYAFYQDTGSRKWGRPYLTRTFFSLIGERMADDVVLIMCRRAGRYIAGALNFVGSDAIYGRNWGALEHHDCLHFEACYYQAIDYAIAHGLARVEAGAQGQHKIARGYLPTTTYSAHWIADPGFRDAVARYLRMERSEVAAEQAALAAYSPFRHRGGD